MHVSPLELFHNMPSQPNLFLSEMDKSLKTNIVVTAMEELVRLLLRNEPLWIKTDGCRDILNLDSYGNLFPRSSSHIGKKGNLRMEASRSSGVVLTNAMTLVDILMDLSNRQSFLPRLLHHLISSRLHENDMTWKAYIRQRKGVGPN